MEDSTPIAIVTKEAAAVLAAATITATGVPVNTITIFDCTGSNLPHITDGPTQKMAGYVTGTNGVAWSADQWARHPDAIRIDQSPINTPFDETADVYDMEDRAGTLTGMSGWYKLATASYVAADRPGQRAPAIYCSRSNVTPVVNRLIQAGITSGVGLWIAEEMHAGDAAQLVQTASGPFPIIGVQYAFQGLFDVSVMSETWFKAVSRKVPISNPNANYEVDFQRYQDGFGWVQDGTLNTHLSDRYRIRVRIGGHDQWTEINL